MKLYYTPGACSLSVHIVLKEAGYDYTLEKVDLKTKKTETGANFLKVNEKGYVPVLELDSGEVLSEASVILQYLADQKPDSQLAPDHATFERLRMNEWLAFISTEIHKGFSPLFGNPSENAESSIKKKLARRFDYIEERMIGDVYLTGSQFTVVDAYLFTVLNWSKSVKIDLDAWPHISAYMKKVGAREGVKAAMQEEGL